MYHMCVMAILPICRYLHAIQNCLIFHFSNAISARIDYSNNGSYFDYISSKANKSVWKTYSSNEIEFTFYKSNRFDNF